jgi:hypothetical protein
VRDEYQKLSHELGHQFGYVGLVALRLISFPSSGRGLFFFLRLALRAFLLELAQRLQHLGHDDQIRSGHRTTHEHAGETPARCSKGKVEEKKRREREKTEEEEGTAGRSP